MATPPACANKHFYCGQSHIGSPAAFVIAGDAQPHSHLFCNKVRSVIPDVYCQHTLSASQQSLVVRMHSSVWVSRWLS